MQFILRFVKQFFRLRVAPPVKATASVCRLVSYGADRARIFLREDLARAAGSNLILDFVPFLAQVGDVVNVPIVAGPGKPLGNAEGARRHCETTFFVAHGATDEVVDAALRIAVVWLVDDVALAGGDGRVFIGSARLPLPHDGGDWTGFLESGSAGARSEDEEIGVRLFGVPNKDGVACTLDWLFAAVPLPAAIR